VVRYGLDPAGNPAVTATGVSAGASGTTATLRDARYKDSVTVSTRLLGRHQLGHVLAAVAVAREAGRTLEELITAIQELRPVEHRLQIIEGGGGITVIDDAYNSNPEGAADALDVLDSIPARQKVVVSPGMIELGALQFEANERFGAHAARVADTVIVVADVNREAIAAGAAAANGRVEIIHVASLSEAQRKLAQLLEPGAIVLFENDLPDQYES
jgi:UDP-N-acetylmuramoyl-tripeptide--D-alanyl-D-alanine ligase